MKHMQKPDYLTDEELMDLITSVETGAGLSAPGYLKESILKKAVPKNRKSYSFLARKLRLLPLTPFCCCLQCRIRVIPNRPCSQDLYFGKRT